MADETGASAVEFAVLMPLLVLLVFGIIEFGLLFYNQQVITNASREGARAAIRGDCNHRLTNAQISQIVTDYCVDPTDATKKRLITFSATNNLPTVSIDPSPSACTPGAAGEYVAVTVQYTYSYLVPSVLGFGPTKQLEAKTIMKMMEPVP